MGMIQGYERVGNKSPGVAVLFYVNMLNLIEKER